MSASKRFSGLMGSADPALKNDVPVVNIAATQVTTEVPAVPVAAPVAAAEPVVKKSKAKVQLNTQQPEELKNAVDKAAAYLSFTPGKKVTTTDVVAQALRIYLDQLPDAAKGL